MSWNHESPRGKKPPGDSDQPPECGGGGGCGPGTKSGHPGQRPTVPRTRGEQLCRGPQTPRFKQSAPWGADLLPATPQGLRALTSDTWRAAARPLSGSPRTPGPAAVGLGTAPPPPPGSKRPGWHRWGGGASPRGRQAACEQPAPVPALQSGAAHPHATYPVPHHPRGLRRSGPLPKRRCLPSGAWNGCGTKRIWAPASAGPIGRGAGPAAGTFGGGRLGNGAGAGENRGRGTAGPKDLSPAARGSGFWARAAGSGLGPRASGLGPLPGSSSRLLRPARGPEPVAQGGAAVDAALPCEASDKMALQGWLSPNTTALPGDQLQSDSPSPGAYLIPNVPHIPQ